MGEQSIWRVLRSLVMPVYVPSVAGTLGIGLLLPVLPLYLRDVGLSFSEVAVVLGAVGIGAMIGGIPSGSTMAHHDERALMAVSLVIMAASTAVFGLTTAVMALVALRFAFGVGFVGLRLSRQTYVTARVETGARGRALSLIGGSFRLSLLVGPVVGGFLADSVGFTPTFLVCGAVTMVGLVGALDRGPGSPASGLSNGERVPLFAALWRYRATLAKAGIPSGLVIAVRQGRYLAVPLIAAELDLSLTAVGGLLAIGTGADLLLFPVSGYVMDRFGRLHAIVPSFLLVTAGLVILGYADTAAKIALAGAVMGVGNGIGAGTMLTMASDLAPAEARGQVLSGLAVLQDTGTLLGPLIVGLVADAAGVGASAFALAAVMVLATAWLVVIVGETGRAPEPEP